MIVIKHPKYLEEGMKFNRLIIIKVDEESKIKDGGEAIPSEWKYICKCECGKLTSIRKRHLVSNGTKSCGCLGEEALSKVQFDNKKGNKIKICKNYIKIFFNKSDKFTIIDKEDYRKIKNFTWYLTFDGYVVTEIQNKAIRKTIRLHRLVMTCTGDNRVDHKYHNKLDNRKKNLRIVTRSQNRMNSKIFKNNTSGIKGVYRE